MDLGFPKPVSLHHPILALHVARVATWHRLTPGLLTAFFKILKNKAYIQLSGVARSVQCQIYLFEYYITRVYLIFLFLVHSK